MPWDSRRSERCGGSRRYGAGGGEASDRSAADAVLTQLDGCWPILICGSEDTVSFGVCCVLCAIWLRLQNTQMAAITLAPRVCSVPDTFNFIAHWIIVIVKTSFKSSESWAVLPAGLLGVT